MPNHVLQHDCTFNAGDVERSFPGGPYGQVWAEVDVAFDATYLADVIADTPTFIELLQFYPSDGGSHWQEIDLAGTGTGWTADPAAPPSQYTPADPITSMQFYRLKMHLTAGSPIACQAWVDGVSIGTLDVTGVNMTDIQYIDLEAAGLSSSGKVFFDNLIVGSTEGASDIYADDFEGDLSGWNSFVSSSSTIVVDPGIAPPSAPTPTASFTSDRNEGTAPLGVKFTDTSTGGPSSWHWNFGDGNTSDQQHPTHVYRDPGSYEATLTVE